MQPTDKQRDEGRHRVWYLELRRAARSGASAKRALGEYHQLLSKKLKPVAFFSREDGYFVVGSEALSPPVRQAARDVRRKMR